MLAAVLVAFCITSGLRGRVKRLEPRRAAVFDGDARDTLLAAAEKDAPRCSTRGGIARRPRVRPRGRGRQRGGHGMGADIARGPRVRSRCCATKRTGAQMGVGGSARRPRGRPRRGRADRRVRCDGREELCADRAVVLAAVGRTAARCSSRAVRFARTKRSCWRPSGSAATRCYSEDGLRRDRDVVRAAVATHNYALKWASDELRAIAQSC